MNKLIPIILGIFIVRLVMQKARRGRSDQYEDDYEPRERGRRRSSRSKSRGRGRGRGRRDRSSNPMGQLMMLLAAAQTARKLVRHLDDFNGHGGRSHRSSHSRGDHDRRSRSRGDKLRGWIGA